MLYVSFELVTRGGSWLSAKSVSVLWDSW